MSPSDELRDLIAPEADQMAAATLEKLIHYAEKHLPGKELILHLRGYLDIPSTKRRMTNTEPRSAICRLACTGPIEVFASPIFWRSGGGITS